MQANTLKRSVVALAVAGAFAAGAVTAERAATIKPAGAAAQPVAVTSVAASASTAALPDFADLVAKHGAAVVQISVTHDMQKTRGGHSEGMPDFDELPPWFRNFPFPKPPSRRPVAGHGLGLHRQTGRRGSHQCPRRCGR